jgi:hypothetical protein
MKKIKNKIKFYDRLLMIGAPGLILAIIFMILFEGLIFNIALIVAVISNILIWIFNFGMIYHTIKTKNYFWFMIEVIAFIFEVTYIPTILFYFGIMRKKFKKSETVDKKKNKKG